MDAYRNMIINRGADDMIFATKEKVKFTETVLCLLYTSRCV